MTSEQRSLQIWALLVCAARERRVYTYMGIAQILGFGGAIPVIPALDNIMWFCRARGLPPLTVLVANGKTGEPGDGLPLDDKSAGEQREIVFGFNWFGIEPPETMHFKEARLNHANV